MSALTKAQLGEITSGDNPTEVDGTLVNVQFNPTTLRVQISNRTAGGQQAGAQARQRPGTGEMQVSFDLIFDTADEGDTENGVSVLEKTKMVERFVRPKGNRPGEEAPPRVIFKWGDFLVQGTMESANIDLDLFDAGGVPLRAKVAVTIKGQDPRWTYTPAPTPPGTGNAAGGATPNTQLPPGTPGTVGSPSAPERIMQAMPGESLAQLAQRAGLDPSAWRAMAAGLSNPLKLSLGEEVSLGGAFGGTVASANTTRDPGKTAASMPLVNAGESKRSGEGSSDRARNQRDRAVDPVRQGQALVAQGGMAGSIASVKRDAHVESANASLSAFGMGASGSADNTDRPWGAGVPLRPRMGSAQGAVRRDPTQAAWIARPAAAPGASAPMNTRSNARSAPRAGCGCRGRRRTR